MDRLWSFKVNDFRFLAGFSSYGITEDGRVFNRLTNRWIGESDGTGYITVHFRGDDGSVSHFMVHRLVATLYVPRSCAEHDVVNHLNGVKSDNRACNLEWTTYRGNHEHAGMAGLTEKCYPVSVRNPQTGSVSHFPSAIKAAAACGLTKDAMLWRLKGTEDRVYPEGLQYRRRDDARPWSDSVNPVYGRSVPILVRDVVSGQVQRYDQQTQLAAALGLSLATVNSVASNGDQRLLNGRYQVKLATDPSPWRIVNDPIVEHGVKRAVVAINDTSGQEQTFTSAKDCAEAMGLKPTTLNERLKSGGTKVFADGYRYRYYIPMVTPVSNDRV